jgi:hypothetical protein
MIRSALPIIVLLSCTMGAAVAHGQTIIKRPHHGPRPYQLDLHAGFAYVGAGLAAGGRFGIPIVTNGFVKKINNAVYINFGADLYFIDSGKNDHAIGLGIPVTLHWEFYFTPEWSAFGEAGPNFFIHPVVFKGDKWKFSGSHWVSVTAGGRYFINNALALTLRIGNPYSSFGVTFLF